MKWLDRIRGGKGVRPPHDSGPTELASTVPKAQGRETVVRQQASPPESTGVSRAAPLRAFAAGERVADAFQIKHLLGEGGMGSVYLAHHESWDLDVALKVPKPEILADPEHGQRITREAEAWTDLGLHPHIAYCYYVQPLEDIPLLVVEYLDGGNLRQWIEEGRCADLKTGLDLAIQMCHGLEHAHGRGLVHRDIKPENLLLAADGTLKVTDFGIVRVGEAAEAPGVVSRAAAGRTLAGMGTYEYMAPEQWKDAHEVDARTDMFALGVCLYELFCGRRPYELATGTVQEAPEPGMLRGEALPKRLNELLLRCVAWRREDRPVTMAEVRRELCMIYEALAGEPSACAELPVVSLAPGGWNNRALSYMALTREEEAERAWAEALKVDPHHPEATYNWGLHRWRQARVTDADVLRDLREVCASHPREWLPRYLEAQVHLERDDSEGARACLDEIAGPDAERSEVRAARTVAEARGTSVTRWLRTFEGHTDWVTSVAPSADGRLALSGSRDTRVKLWEAGTGCCLRTFEGHTREVSSVTLSGDGRLALSGSWDHSVKLWEVETGRCLRTFEVRTDAVSSVTLSADGRLALSGNFDKTVKLWEIATGRCLRTFEGHTAPVWSVDMSPDGRLALSGSKDKTVKLWEVATGRCLRTLEGHTIQVSSVALSADGQLALSGSEDRTVKLWEVGTGRCLRTLEGHTDKVTAVALSGDGRLALSGSWDHSVKLWEVGTGRCIRTLEGHTRYVQAVALSARRRVVGLSGSVDKTVRLWEVADPPSLRVATVRVSRPVETAVATRVAAAYQRALAEAAEALRRGDATKAAAHVRAARAQPGYGRQPEALGAWGALYGRLPRTALTSGWEAARFEGHTGDVTGVALSGDGRLAVSGSKDKTVKLWEVATGRCLRTFEGHTHPVESVELGADGRLALSGSRDRTVKLWEVATGRCLRTFAGHTHFVASVGLSADGRVALSGSFDKTVKLWEMATGRCLRTFEGLDLVTSVALSADGRVALSGGSDKRLRLWDVATGQCIRTFEGHTIEVTAVALSADGRLALSGCHDATLKLWDVAAARCLRTFEEHTGVVESATLSIDRRLAVSAGHDMTVKLWDVATGSCLRTFEGHSAAVTSVSMSSDVRLLVSGSEDRTVRLWILDWDLAEVAPADWDEGARPYLEGFLRAHQPYVGEPPTDRKPTEDEMIRALTRTGRPVWTDDEFQRLLFHLGCVGYGWVRPEGVRRELERMALTWGEA